MTSPEIRIAFAPLHPGDEGVKLHVSPEMGPELRQDLERAGFRPRVIMEFSIQDEPMMIFAVAGAFATIGGLRGLAAVLVAFFERHNGASIKIRVGKNKMSLTKMPVSEMRPIIEDFLAIVKADQELLDDQSRARMERRAIEADEERPTDPRPKR